ncbi:YgjV family protein, partial [Tardiphaga sp.]|uniref:YgjV family protein n=1 Tax=Tardiphaga sp. TaxID=1926292 RepID=UPI00352A1DD3
IRCYRPIRGPFYSRCSHASMLSCTQLICAVAVSERRFVQAVTGVSALVLAFMAVATWQGVPSLLALIGGLAGSVARLQPTTKRMKLVFLAGAPFWVAHNLLVGATFASCVDVASIGGNLSSLWRTRSNNNVLRAFATALQPFGRMSARIVRS